MKDYIPFLFVLAFICLVVFVVRRDSKKDEAALVKVEPTGVLPYPCFIEGHFSCPPQAQAIAARNASLIAHGHGIELPDDPNNNASRNNTILGGGTPYGGIYLAGSFVLEIDMRGQVTANSYIKVFSDEKYPVTGGIEPNGKVGMASPVGVSIAGIVRDGIVTMKVSEAGRSLNTNGNDPTWTALSEVDKSALDGNRYGTAIEYVHGVVAATYVRLPT